MAVPHGKTRTRTEAAAGRGSRWPEGGPAGPVERRARAALAPGERAMGLPHGGPSTEINGNSRRPDNAWIAPQSGPVRRCVDAGRGDRCSGARDRLHVVFRGRGVRSPPPRDPLEPGGPGSRSKRLSDAMAREHPLRPGSLYGNARGAPAIPRWRGRWRRLNNGAGRQNGPGIRVTGKPPAVSTVLSA